MTPRIERDTPRLRELVFKHEDETKALIAKCGMAGAISDRDHALRQVNEVIALAQQLERDLHAAKVFGHLAVMEAKRSGSYAEKTLLPLVREFRDHLLDSLADPLDGVLERIDAALSKNTSLCERVADGAPAASENGDTGASSSRVEDACSPSAPLGVGNANSIPDRQEP